MKAGGRADRRPRQAGGVALLEELGPAIGRGVLSLADDGALLGKAKAAGKKALKEATTRRCEPDEDPDEDDCEDED